MTRDQVSKHMLFTTKEFRHDSFWFSGHFPDNPVLPGIAQLSTVFDLIRQSTDGKVSIKEIKRVKFKQIINPNDPLEIQAVRNQLEPDTYSFVIRVKEETACQGIIILRRKAMITAEGEKNED